MDHDSSDPGGSDAERAAARASTDSRRGLIKKAAMGGAALWVAPTVLALDTRPASASPNCAGATPRVLLPFPGMGATTWTATASLNNGMPTVTSTFGPTWSNGQHMGYNAGVWPDVGYLPGGNFIVVRNPANGQTPWARYRVPVRLCANTAYTFTFPLAAEKVATGTPRPQTFRARITTPSSTVVDLPLTSTSWTGSPTFLQTRGTPVSGGAVPTSGWGTGAQNNRFLNNSVVARYPATGNVAADGDFIFDFYITFPSGTSTTGDDWGVGPPTLAIV